MNDNEKIFVTNDKIHKLEYDKKIFYIPKNIIIIIMYFFILYVFLEMLKLHNTKNIESYMAFMVSFGALLYAVYQEYINLFKNKKDDINIYIKRIIIKKKKMILVIKNSGKTLEKPAEIKIFDEENNCTQVKFFQFIESDGYICIDVIPIQKFKRLKYSIDVISGNEVINIKYIQGFSRAGKRIKDNSNIIVKKIYYRANNLRTLFCIGILIVEIYKIIEILMVK